MHLCGFDGLARTELRSIGWAYQVRLFGAWYSKCAMDSDLKKRLGITVLIFVVAGVAEVGYLKWSRRDTSVPKKQEPTYSSNQDDYVTPR